MIQYPVKNYLLSITESVFESIKNNKIDGVSVKLELADSILVLTHSMFIKNEYQSGAVLAKGISILMNNLCFDNNKGVSGSHHCDSIVYNIESYVVNNTNEKADHSYHGPFPSGRQECDFCYNNVTHSTVADLSVWHYLSSNKQSFTVYCQMTNCASPYLSSWNTIASSFNLKWFNFLNCTCSVVNLNYNKNTIGQLTYTECVFFLGCSPSIGDYSIYQNCVSDGSVSGSGIVQSGYPNDIKFSALLFCKRGLKYDSKEELNIAKCLKFLLPILCVPERNVNPCIVASL